MTCRFRLVAFLCALAPAPAFAVNNATVLSVQVPASVAPSAAFLVTVTFRNDGPMTWLGGSPTSSSAAGTCVCGFHLGIDRAHELDNPPRFGLTRLDPAYPVTPGQTVAITIPMTAPAISGSYATTFQMVWDWKEWFGAIGTATIVVQSGPPPPDPPPPPVGEYVIPGFAPEVRQLPPDPGDGSIVGDIILNTGVYTVGSPSGFPGNVHHLDWTNTTGRTLLIRQSGIWTGVDKDAVMDLGAYAVRLRDLSVIQHHPWDHYANPVAPDQFVLRDHGAGMTLLPGDVIRFYYYAMWPNSSAHAAHMFELRVTYVP